MTVTLAQAGAAVIEMIRTLGIRCSPHSRLARMMAILQQGYIAPDDKGFDVAREALRDIRLMDFALSELIAICPREILAAKVRLALGDAPLVQNSGGRSPGRDAQCELYVAGVCARAGIGPEFAEPDVVCTVKDNRYGIAIKRVKNVDRIEEHFRRAVVQISNAGMAGFVVMDLSVAFNPDNRALVSDADVAEMRLAHDLARQTFLSQYFDRMKAWTGGREVRGLIILDHILRYDPGPRDWSLETFTDFVSFCAHNQRRKREFDSFQKTYTRGLVNLIQK